MIIVGITDNCLRERLFCEADLTSEHCIQLGHAAEQLYLSPNLHFYKSLPKQAFLG